MMLQGAGLLVISILFIGHSESIEHPKYAISGVFSFFVAYGMYWIAGDFYELSSWSWEVFLAVGMISLPISFVGFIKNTHT
jgi:putative flippase GtrA